MTQRPNPERARMLRQRGYSHAEVTLHMCEEGRDVHESEVIAWCNYATPPKLFEFEGQRGTLSEIARLACVNRKLLESRLTRGMSVVDAITRPIKNQAQAARTAESPWRTHASCGGGTR